MNNFTQLYTAYNHNGYGVFNYDLEVLTKDFTATTRILKEHKTSNHNEYDEFEDVLIEMRSIVGEYNDDHYIVAKRYFDKTVWEIVEYK